MADLTIKDIAKLCNVSISTVSRAMNNDPGINEKTKERVLEVVNKFHYIPNNSARNLKMVESNTIGLLIKGINNPFFQGLMALFESEMKKEGYTFQLQALREEDDAATVAMQLAKEKRLKGIVFLGGRMEYPDADLQNIPIPFVLCSVAVEVERSSISSPSVTIDDEKESYRAANYLISQGHERIAFITGHEDDTTVARLRFSGYKRALEDANIPYDPELVCYTPANQDSYTEECGYQLASRILKSGKKFTAFYAISDRMAVGVYKAVDDAGKKVPDDYSVMGFDGIPLTKYMIPPLTTMVQPAEQMAKSSMDLLMKQIRGEDAHEKLIYDARLKVRDSVRKIKRTAEFK
ncbi:MAG: LacI family DNA-binding transcriptional regulator [Eubacterium sp.]|nr:LacI family DNA-binding transcriptional regulator [Eubacterium sp.]